MKAMMFHWLKMKLRVDLWFARGGAQQGEHRGGHFSQYISRRPPPTLPMFLPIFLAGVNPCGLSAWIAKMEACRSCLGTAAETRLRSGVTGRAKELLMPSRTKSISKVKTRPPFWGNY